jgi:ABC-type uncharacterized transport system fused permease/ATPase subunit
MSHRPPGPGRSVGLKRRAGASLKLRDNNFQANVVIPYIIVAPYFFLGKITLGQMTQTAGAFGRVESALTFFIARYQSLASYKAVVERSDDISLGHQRGASAWHETAAHRTH